jgi:hypothetical protein
MPTKNSTRRLRSDVRRRSTALLIAAIGTLAACNQDKLLTVPTPDVVLPKDLTGSTVLPNAYAAAIGDFQVAYAGSGGNVTGTFGSTEGLVIMSGLLSDELLDAETFPTRLEVDRRATNPVNATMLAIFQLAQRARDRRAGRGQLRAVRCDQPESRRGAGARRLHVHPVRGGLLQRSTEQQGERRRHVRLR